MQQEGRRGRRRVGRTRTERVAWVRDGRDGAAQATRTTHAVKLGASGGAVGARAARDRGVTSSRSSHAHRRRPRCLRVGRLSGQRRRCGRAMSRCRGVATTSSQKQACTPGAHAAEPLRVRRAGMSGLLALCVRGWRCSLRTRSWSSVDFLVANCACARRACGRVVVVRVAWSGQRLSEHGADKVRASGGEGC